MPLDQSKPDAENQATKLCRQAKWGHRLTLPVVETDARQDRSGCHNRSRAPSFGPAIHTRRVRTEGSADRQPKCM